MSKKELISVSAIFRWTGRIIMGCSIFAIMVLLVMRIVENEKIYLTDVLIFIGYALIGFAMSYWNRKKSQQEDGENE